MAPPAKPFPVYRAPTIPRFPAQTSPSRGGGSSRRISSGNPCACLRPPPPCLSGETRGRQPSWDGSGQTSAKAEKIVRDQLEERVVAGSLRTETDPQKLVALLDDRVDLDLKDLRAGPPRALDYANVIDALLARAELEGFSHEEIEATRVARLAARGSFRGGVVWTPPDPVFRIAHEVPRRIRLEAATLKGDAAAGAVAEACLADMPGVRSARANP